MLADMTDTLTRAERSRLMSKIRCKNTGPERAVRSLLHRAGYRFRIHVRGLPGTPDVVLPKYRTVVFVHGCFWHRHRGCKIATMLCNSEPISNNHATIVKICCWPYLADKPFTRWPFGLLGKDYLPLDYKYIIKLSPHGKNFFGW